MRYAGVIEDQVDLAVRLRRLCRPRKHRRTIGDIEHPRADFYRIGGTQPGGLLQAIFIKVA